MNSIEDSEPLSCAFNTTENSKHQLTSKKKVIKKRKHKPKSKSISAASSTSRSTQDVRVREFRKRFPRKAYDPTPGCYNTSTSNADSIIKDLQDSEKMAKKTLQRQPKLTKKRVKFSRAKTSIIPSQTTSTTTGLKSALKSQTIKPTPKQLVSIPLSQITNRQLRFDLGLVEEEELAIASASPPSSLDQVENMHQDLNPASEEITNNQIEVDEQFGQLSFAQHSTPIRPSQNLSESNQSTNGDIGSEAKQNEKNELQRLTSPYAPSSLSSNSNYLGSPPDGIIFSDDQDQHSYHDASDESFLGENLSSPLAVHDPQEVMLSLTRLTSPNITGDIEPPPRPQSTNVTSVPKETVERRLSESSSTIHVQPVLKPSLASNRAAISISPHETLDSNNDGTVNSQDQNLRDDSSQTAQIHYPSQRSQQRFPSPATSSPDLYVDSHMNDDLAHSEDGDLTNFECFPKGSSRVKSSVSLVPKLFDSWSSKFNEIEEADRKEYISRLTDVIEREALELDTVLALGTKCKREVFVDESQANKHLEADGLMIVKTGRDVLRSYHHHYEFDKDRNTYVCTDDDALIHDWHYLIAIHTGKKPPLQAIRAVNDGGHGRNQSRRQCLLCEPSTHALFNGPNTAAAHCQRLTTHVILNGILRNNNCKQEGEEQSANIFKFGSKSKLTLQHCRDWVCGKQEGRESYKSCALCQVEFDHDNPYESHFDSDRHQIFIRWAALKDAGKMDPKIPPFNEDNMA